MATPQVKLQDLDIFARSDANGGLRVLEEDLAISNALVAWLSSKAGDYIYRPDLGGVLEIPLFKLMTPQRTKDLQNFFRSKIEENFGGVLSLDRVSVIPDNTTRTYNFIIEYTSLLTNKENLVNFNTSQKPKEAAIKTTVEVPFVNENLLNFVLVKKIDLPGIVMQQDPITNLWIWGPYIFTNLRNIDYNFQEIFDITREP